MSERHVHDGELDDYDADSGDDEEEEEYDYDYENVPESVNNVCGNFEQGDANYKMQCLRLNKIGKFVQCRGSDSLPVMLVQFSWSQN